MRLKPLVFVLFVLTLCGGGSTVYFFVNSLYMVASVSLIVTCYLFYYTLKTMFKVFRNMEDFVEAVRYRDFSKRYPERGNQRNIFYKHFNAISDAFLAASREKEVQQQYLKRILELVNTGILAYNVETLETLWMNDSFNAMFKIPYVKNHYQTTKITPNL